MVLKNLIKNTDIVYKSKFNINKILCNENLIIEDELNSDNSKYFDLIITSSIENIKNLCKKFPASSIILLSKNDYSNIPDNVFLLSEETDNFNLINNILNISKINKESIFRKIIIILEKQTEIKIISKLVKKIGFELKMFKNIKLFSDFISQNKIEEGKSKILYKIDLLIGFYIKKNNKIYFFHSFWHEESNINKNLVKELRDGIKKSLFFNNSHKISNLGIKNKGKFLGDHIGEGLFILDTSGRITFFNKIFDKMFSLENKYIIGKKLNEIIPINKDIDLLKKWSNNSHEPISIELESNYSGLNKHFYVTYSPIIENKKIINICGIIRDITLQKIMEKQIIFSKDKSEKINRSLLSVQNAIILGFSKLSEYKDRETGAHLERIQNYVKVLATEVYNRALFVDYDTKKNYLSEKYVDELALSSLLHDIGKVGIPDNILLKPDRLTNEEYGYMQLHTKIGGDTLTYIDQIVGELSFLAIAKEIAYYHHEKWNGLGYPFGLKHDKIPLSARIVAICDVYDALTTARPYKDPYTHEKTCGIIYDLSGIQFDPIIISVFSSVENDFREIRNRFED